MDDQTFLPPLTTKERSRSGRGTSEQTTELLAKTNVFSLLTLAGSPGETRQNKRKSK
jgi:hypothetical protein